MWARAHFYLNKYIATPFSNERFHLSYCSEHQALWFRNAKVASRSIDHQLREASGRHGYWYSSRVGYFPALYKGWFKFGFVRHPVDRLLSAWRDKVCTHNLFAFAPDDLRRMQRLEEFVGWLEKQDIEECNEHIQVQFKQFDLDRMDLIGRFERFDEDFKKVTDRLGIQPKDHVHLNPSAPVEVQLTDDLRGRIMTIYRRDMELFYP